MRLPDGQGWLVARYGAGLRYRLPGGEWRDAGREAALLPDAPRLEVEVTPEGGAARTVSIG